MENEMLYGLRNSLQVLQARFDEMETVGRLTRVRIALLTGGITHSSVVESDLVLEAEVEAGKDELKFFVNDIGESGLREVKLNQRDVFVVVSWDMTMLGVTAQWVVTEVDRTWPSVEMYSDREIAREAEIFYNSKLSVYVNNKAVIWKYHTGIFRREYDRTVSSFPIDPYVVLSGTRNNAVYLRMPREVLRSDPGQMVRIRLHGYLAIDALVVDGK